MEASSGEGLDGGQEDKRAQGETNVRRKKERGKGTMQRATSAVCPSSSKPLRSSVRSLEAIEK